MHMPWQDETDQLTTLSTTNCLDDTHKISHHTSKHHAQWVSVSTVDSTTSHNNDDAELNRQNDLHKHNRETTEVVQILVYIYFV